MNDSMSISKRVKGLLDEHGISQNKLALEIDLSPATVSGYLKGTYAGDVVAIEEKLEKWLFSFNRRHNNAYLGPLVPEWKETPTAKKIWPVAEYAQYNHDIGLVFGAAGVGKTYTLNHYADDHLNVWVATMTPAHAGVAPCLEEIALALEMKDAPCRSARLLREIIRRVRDTKGLLIIDEAQHLTAAALEVIRSIHDATGIGLLLSGNETVFSQLTGGAARTATFAQLFSRVGKRLRITRPLKGDVAAIAEIFGVESGKALQAAWIIGQKPGGLRGVVKTLRLAGTAAVGAQKTIDESFIKAAWQDLTGEVTG